MEEGYSWYEQRRMENHERFINRQRIATYGLVVFGTSTIVASSFGLNFYQELGIDFESARNTFLTTALFGTALTLTGIIGNFFDE